MIDRYPFPEKTVYKVLLAAYLFLILYFTRVSQVSHYLIGFYRAQFISLLLTAGAALFFLIYRRKDFKRIVLNYRVALALLFAAAILIPMVCKRDWQMMYFSILFSILIGVFLSYFVTCCQAAKAYTLILTALAAYSLLTFFRFPFL